MNLRKRIRRSGALWAIGLMFVAPARPAQAALVFAITDPVWGVLALNSSTKTFTSATNNPASASVEGASASLSLSGSQLTFSANVGGVAGDRFVATTGSGKIPTDGRIGPVGVLIVGTAGESRNTPFTITLDSVYSGPDSNLVTQIANGTDYPPNATSVFSGLHVGDTFEFWAGINGNDASSAALTTTLTIASSPGALTPEPGIASLLCGLGAIGVALLRRQRHHSTITRKED